MERPRRPYRRGPPCRRGALQQAVSDSKGATAAQRRYRVSAYAHLPKLSVLTLARCTQVGDAGGGNHVSPASRPPPDARLDTYVVAACSQAGVDYTGFGLRPGWDWVAACSQAGVDYTRGQTVPRPGRVAACSQAGVDYTLGGGWMRAAGVAACSQAGVDYTSPAGHSVRFCVAACSQAGVDYTDQFALCESCAVAACSQAGVDYTLRATL